MPMTSDRKQMAGPVDDDAIVEGERQAGVCGRIGGGARTAARHQVVAGASRALNSADRYFHSKI